ncbi:hypothetical protein COU57_05290 [Candidatus Pacearchaeota archaeon CG10_big_fil_rev_8_21_14_0_10_32_14]|nr:MAG: hypothetical protein COU57_05290 [Candidatus Pacearchaeota archaeon CG10_big_fil_rev_8_21_14_0_10_32_14]
MNLKKNFKRKVLKNGFVVIHEKRDLPIVSVAIAVRNGGMNEQKSEKGISHFIEHMLYKGTPSRNAKKIADEIEKNGGELNGFTSENVTAYWCKMPSEHIDLALDVLSDMTKNPLFEKEELEKERQVIFEEMKMRKDTPRIYVFDEIQSFLYEEPLGQNLIGTIESMGKIDREIMKKKFEEIYTPNNMMLVVVGDCDFNKLIKFAEITFGNVKKKGKVPQYDVKLKNEIKLEKRKGIDQVNLVFGHHVPLCKDEKSYVAHILNAIMAGGMSSRLFAEIREKRNLAYAVKGDCNISEKYAYNIIYVGTTKDNLDKVKGLIIKEFEDVSKNLSEKELTEAVNQLVGNYKISMEDSQMQMVSLMSHEIDNDIDSFYEYEKHLKNVKISDVKKLASDVIKSHSVFALVPE